MGKKFTREQIREKMMNRKRRLIPLEITLPDLEDLDGELALQELSAKDFEDADRLSVTKDGQSTFLENAYLIVRALIDSVSGQRIYGDDDAPYIVETFGTQVMIPLVGVVKDHCGAGAAAYEAAKKNWQKIHATASPSSSVSGSEGPGPGPK